jgi:hypothetical protein
MAVELRLWSKAGNFLTTRGNTGWREGLRSMEDAFSRVGLVWKKDFFSSQQRF